VTIFYSLFTWAMSIVLPIHSILSIRMFPFLALALNRVIPYVNSSSGSTLHPLYNIQDTPRKQINKPTCHGLYHTLQPISNGYQLCIHIPSISVSPLFLPIHVVFCSHQAFAFIWRDRWLVPRSFCRCRSLPIWFVICSRLCYPAPTYAM